MPGAEAPATYSVDAPRLAAREEIDEPHDFPLCQAWQAIRWPYARNHPSSRQTLLSYPGFCRPVNRCAWDFSTKFSLAGIAVRRCTATRPERWGNSGGHVPSHGAPWSVRFATRESCHPPEVRGRKEAARWPPAGSVSPPGRVLCPRWSWACRPQNQRSNGNGRSPN